MRALALLLALAVAPSDGLRLRREPGRLERMGGRAISGATVAAAQTFTFGFAPADGTGMGTVCACNNVTSSDGTALTLSRSTVATCAPGSWWTGIDPSVAPLVSCGVNKPVIEPGQSGTGQLRLLAEASGVNYATNCTNMVGSGWGKNNSVGSDCVVSGPDAGMDPFGGNRATRVTCPLTTAGTYAQVYNLNTTPGSPAAESIFVRTPPGVAAQTFHLSVADGVSTY